MRNYKLLTIFFLFIFVLEGFSQENVTIPLITTESIQNDVEKVNCDNEKRIDAVKKLFIEKGAFEKDLEIKDYEKVKNLVVTKKGKTDEIVVVGAHYDKTDQGCGAIDNWTGIVIIANLFQKINAFDTNKTFKFVAFGREEDGLIGSKALVKEIPKDDRTNYCSMINFDSFGFAYTQAMANTSTGSLIILGEEVAEEIEIPYGNAPINFADADSSSFKDKKIPAITLHGLTNNWDKYLHSSEDKLKNINYNSVFVGYIFGLRMLAKIDSLGCQTFREKYKKKSKK